MARSEAWRGPIPLTLPSLEGDEQAYVAQAVAHGRLAGDGEFTKRSEKFLQEALGVPRVLLTTSCTSALDMAAILLDISSGDEVIIPSFTFVSCANAFVMRGAKPVFADVREDTLNLDETKLEALITPQTKAIVFVNYAGVACAMDALLRIAGAHGVALIEDNAHGLFGAYRGRQLGTFGKLATLSFHETKNFTCGEGGALILNDEQLVDRAEIIREKGTDRSRFYRGMVDKYTWVDIGSSYLPSDILAAVLLGQLEKRDQIQSARRAMWNRYFTELRPWADANDVRLPVVPPDAEHAYHLFHMVMPSFEARQRLIAQLKTENITAAFHYIPLHLSAMGGRYGGRAGQCPTSERIADCMVRIPFYNHLAFDAATRVIEAVTQFKV